MSFMEDKSATKDAMSSAIRTNKTFRSEEDNRSGLHRESKSVLEDLHQKQENRVKNLYNSAEVNLNTITARENKPYRHSNHLSNQRGINTKNRYNKILQVRERYREDRLRLNREKIHDMQSYNDYLVQCELDSRGLLEFTDLDQLIEEENELATENIYQPESELSLEAIMEMLDISED